MHNILLCGRNVTKYIKLNSCYGPTGWHCHSCQWMASVCRPRQFKHQNNFQKAQEWQSLSLSLRTNCFVVESNVSADKDNTPVLVTEVQCTHVTLFLQQTVWVCAWPPHMSLHAGRSGRTICTPQHSVNINCGTAVQAKENEKHTGQTLEDQSVWVYDQHELSGCDVLWRTQHVAVFHICNTGGWTRQRTFLSLRYIISIVFFICLFFSVSTSKRLEYEW